MWQREWELKGEGCHLPPPGTALGCWGLRAAWGDRREGCPPPTSRGLKFEVNLHLIKQFHCFSKKEKKKKQGKKKLKTIYNPITYSFELEIPTSFSKTCSRARRAASLRLPGEVTGCDRQGLAYLARSLTEHLICQCHSARQDMCDPRCMQLPFLNRGPRWAGKRPSSHRTSES